MMYGHVETIEQRIEHLEHIRNLQDETGGFTAFIAWNFQPDYTALANDQGRWNGVKATGFDYLRTIAIAPPVFGQYQKFSSIVGNAGRQGRTGQPKIRRERFWQHNDGRKRGQCSGHEPYGYHDTSRDATAQFGMRDTSL